MVFEESNSSFDKTVPASAELVLDRLTRPDDGHYVGVVMRVQQFETAAVVETAIKIDSLDAGVKTVKEFEKLSEDIASGFASD